VVAGNGNSKQLQETSNPSLKLLVGLLESASFVKARLRNFWQNRLNGFHPRFRELAYCMLILMLLVAITLQSGKPS